jgi:hypothetical protein
VFHSAIKQNILALPAYIDLLSTLTADSPDLVQSLRHIHIAIAQSIPYESLPEHLATIALLIMDTPENSAQRTELLSAAFKMVIEGLSDESRETGMDWWLAWKGRFVGSRRQGKVAVRAAL